MASEKEIRRGRKKVMNSRQKELLKFNKEFGKAYDEYLDAVESNNGLTRDLEKKAVRMWGLIHKADILGYDLGDEFNKTAEAFMSTVERLADSSLIAGMAKNVSRFAHDHTEKELKKTRYLLNENNMLLFVSADKKEFFNCYLTAWKNIFLEKLYQNNVLGIRNFMTRTDLSALENLQLSSKRLYYVRGFKRLMKKTKLSAPVIMKMIEQANENKPLFLTKQAAKEVCLDISGVIYMKEPGSPETAFKSTLKSLIKSGLVFEGNVGEYACRVGSSQK